MGQARTPDQHYSSRHHLCMGMRPWMWTHAHAEVRAIGWMDAGHAAYYTYMYIYIYKIMRTYTGKAFEYANALRIYTSLYYGSNVFHGKATRTAIGFVYTLHEYTYLSLSLSTCTYGITPCMHGHNMRKQGPAIDLLELRLHIDLLDLQLHLACIYILINLHACMGTTDMSKQGPSCNDSC